MIPLNTYLNGIIESGNNENGSYTKFEDGTLICNYTQIVNTNVENAWGSIFVSPYITLHNFPVSFVNIPEVSIQACRAQSTWIISGSENSKIKPMDVYLGTAVKIPDNFDFPINVIAKGKWK